MTQNNRTSLGVALMMGFVLLGPLIDIAAKLATATTPVFQIAVGRFVVQAALLLPLALAFARPKRSDLALYLIRGALILGSTATIVGAVKFMPIADAIAIVFVEPLFLLLLGWAFLGEGIGPRRIIACITGFVGALLVIQPSFVAFGWPAILPLFTAIFFAIYLLLTRTMAQRLHPIAMQAHTAVAALVIGLPILWLMDGSGMEWIDPIWPDQTALFWIGMCGLAATVSHLFLTAAFRHAEVSVLGTVHYLEIVTAAIYGYLVFGDVVNGLAAVGVGIIIATGMFLIWRERLAQTKAQRQPPQDI